MQGSGWLIAATAVDLGTTFHAPTEFLPLYNRALNRPDSAAVNMQCCGNGVHSEIVLPPLYGYRITDVTQTIDQFAIEQVEMTNQYRRRGAHTARTYGVEIPPLAGDFNRDGFVDAADYARWRNTAEFGEMPNGSAPGFAVAGDYSFWRANFGRAAFNVGASVTVPEPATWVLVCVGLIALLSRKRG